MVCRDVFGRVFLLDLSARYWLNEYDVVYSRPF